MVILHVLVEKYFFGGKPLPVGFELQQRAARSVVGGKKHPVAADNRSGDIGGAVGHGAIFPKQPAVTDIDA